MERFIGKEKGLTQVDRRARWQGTQLVRLVLFIAIFFSHSAIAFAEEAVLSWDANTEPDLAGYRVYIGTTPGTYGTPIDIDKQIASFSTTSLTPGTYFFAVTAIDNSGNESGFSNEVFKTITDSGGSESSGGGGCGMVTPKDGKPRGPGQAADMLTVIGIIMLLLLKGACKRVGQQAGMP